MIDGGLRKIFKEKLPHFHWQSIETGGTGRGIPDSNFCYKGIEGWVEYKVTDGWLCDLRPEQVGWHLKRHRAGGRTWIAVRRKHDGGPRKGPPVDELWIAPGKLAKELQEYGLKLEHPELHMFPAPWPWSRLEGLLLEI